ncbi:MAG: hypothetical protein ABMA02_13875 [Saprospiraceae bacterium]
MHTFNRSISLPSWLSIVGSELVSPPAGVGKYLKALKNNLQQALLGRYETLNKRSRS